MVIVTKFQSLFFIKKLNLTIYNEKIHFFEQNIRFLLFSLANLASFIQGLMDIAKFIQMIIKDNYTCRRGKIKKSCILIKSCKIKIMHF